MSQINVAVWGISKRTFDERGTFHGICLVTLFFCIFAFLSCQPPYQLMSITLATCIVMDLLLPWQRGGQRGLFLIQRSPLWMSLITVLCKQLTTDIVCPFIISFKMKPPSLLFSRVKLPSFTCLLWFQSLLPRQGLASWQGLGICCVIRRHYMDPLLRHHCSKWEIKPQLTGALYPKWAIKRNSSW